MTRDEAIARTGTLHGVCDVGSGNVVIRTDQFVDALAKLGVLTLAAPEVEAARLLTGARISVTEVAYGTGNIPETAATWIIAELGRRGFKITKE